MKITHSLAELQQEHVVMELECIDRMYVICYVPKLTSEGGSRPFAGATWAIGLPPPSRPWR